MILPAAHGDLRLDSAAPELAHCFARAQELAGEVHVEHELPVLQAHLVQRRIALQPGVVHQDVDAAPGVDRLLEHGLHLVLFAHVGVDGDGLAAAPGGSRATTCSARSGPVT